MIRTHLTRQMAILIALVAFALVSSLMEPTVAEAQRKPTRTPKPPSMATPAPQLQAPTLLSPPNGGTDSGQVTFTWSAVPGAACYHLQAGLGTSLDEQFNIIDRGCVAGTSYSFFASEGFVVYFPHLHWRVRARDANNLTGPWSEVWKVYLTYP